MESVRETDDGARGEHQSLKWDGRNQLNKRNKIYSHRKIIKNGTKNYRNQDYMKQIVFANHIWK